MTKATRINRGPTTGISNIFPGFMLQMYFAFFNVEIIRGFTSTFVAIRSSTSLPFVFPSRSKRPPLDNLKFIVTTLRNQDNKVSFIRVDEDGALARSSEFMKKCHTMNTIVHNKGVYVYAISGKSESTIKTLYNIIRALLLNLIHKK